MTVRVPQTFIYGYDSKTAPRGRSTTPNTDIPRISLVDLTPVDGADGNALAVNGRGGGSIQLLNQ